MFLFVVRSNAYVRNRFCFFIFFILDIFVVSLGCLILYYKYVRLFNILVFGLGFSGCVCVRMLKVCICIQLDCVRKPMYAHAYSCLETLTQVFYFCFFISFIWYASVLTFFSFFFFFFFLIMFLGIYFSIWLFVCLWHARLGFSFSFLFLL